MKREIKIYVKEYDERVTWIDRLTGEKHFPEILRQYYEEIPPNAQLLTREQVEAAVSKHTYQSSEGLADYTESLDTGSFLDELFPNGGE